MTLGKGKIYHIACQQGSRECSMTLVRIVDADTGCTIPISPVSIVQSVRVAQSVVTSNLQPHPS